MCTNRGRIPILFRLIIGLTLACVCFDVLHMVDLGVAPHVIGNVLMRCIKAKVFFRGGTDQAQVENVSSLAADYFKQKKMRKTQTKGP